MRVAFDAHTIGQRDTGNEAYTLNLLRALTVTAQGRRLANRAVVAVEGCDRAFFAPLQGSADSFTGWLRRLADA